MDEIDDEMFEDWVFEAIDMLPEQFRDKLGSVAIVVEDRASQEELDRLGVPGLYGLYHGVPRSAPGADHSLVPAKITIYRQPCIASSRTREGVRERVIETVHHEIAHHFGISDARLRELGVGSHRHR
jgi:predicted Zn-dependent protease with MMP-like domain